MAPENKEDDASMTTLEEVMKTSREVLQSFSLKTELCDETVVHLETGNTSDLVVETFEDCNAKALFLQSSSPLLSFHNC